MPEQVCRSRKNVESVFIHKWDNSKWFLSKGVHFIELHSLTWKNKIKKM